MPSPWITRMVAEQVALDLCQHVQCRKGEHRQDLQCQRIAHGPEIRHLHAVALGFCDPRWLDTCGDRHGGHTNPFHKS